jgi:hypothetical protein
VPLATDERGVTCATESRGPGFVAQQLLINVENTPAGQEHGAGWHAGGAVHPTLHVGAVEGETAPHEPVEVWRLDLRIAQRSDRVGALVIGEEKENIWPFRGHDAERVYSENRKNTVEEKYSLHGCFAFGPGRAGGFALGSTFGSRVVMAAFTSLRRVASLT